MVTTPEPYHRWAANEDGDVKAFSMKDRCRTCGVARYNPMSGTPAIKSNAVAAGPCPERPWKDITAPELRPYVLAYLDEPSTAAERALKEQAEAGLPL